MNRFENFKAGLIKDNPVFSLFLGICSTLAITTTVNNAIGPCTLCCRGIVFQRLIVTH